LEHPVSCKLGVVTNLFLKFSGLHMVHQTLIFNPLNRDTRAEGSV